MSKGDPLDQLSRVLPSAFRPSREFVLYSLIGLSGATLDFLIFNLLLYGLGTHYLLANLVGATSGIVNNFLLNRHFNFRKYDHALKRFIAFLAVGVFGLLVASILLYIGVDLFHWHPVLVKLATIFVVVVIQYSLNRFWTFGRIGTGSS